MKKKEITIKYLIEQAICNGHEGKMKGIPSLSTSVLLNERCYKNAQIDGSICQFCYAHKLASYRDSLARKLERNTELLTKELINDNDVPFINAAYFRFEAFGDLNNSIQVRNYFTIARNNPHCNFALWTKNPQFIQEAMNDGAMKPDNLIVIYSSLFLNMKNRHITKKYPFIDKVFTVYDTETINRENIEINCGARSCATCLKCYRKNEFVEIREKLK